MGTQLEEICKEKYLNFIKENNVALEDKNTFEARKNLLKGLNLHNSETIECVAGVMSASLGMNRRSGLVVATNERIFLLLKKGLGGSEINTFYFSRISSIGFKSTMTLSDVMIHTDGEKEEKFNCAAPDKLAAIFEELLYKFHSKSKVKIENNQAEIKNEDIVGKIERIFQLKQAGAISKEEFELMKKKIINS